MKFFGRIKNGKIDILDKKKLDYALKKYDGSWAEIELGGRRRSVQQNRYYWGVVVDAIANETGLSPEEVHDFAKSKFLRRTIRIKNKDIVVIGSSASLNTEEFSDFAEKLRIWAGEFLNLVIPLPEEY